MIMPGFAIHGDFHDSQVVDQPSRFQNFQDRIKVGIYEELVLHADHEQTAGAGDTKQGFKRLRPKMAGRKCSGRYNRAIVIRYRL